MAETIIERAANAIREIVFEGNDVDEAVHAEAANRAARAVLTAIREPSEGMIEVGGDYFDTAIPIEVDGLWKAMIDAALAEEG